MEEISKFLLKKPPKFFKKASIILGAIFVSNVLLYLSFPKLLEFGIKDQVSLKKSNKVRSIYLKLPFPLVFDIYFFNVSNPEEVQNGAKPRVEEIGPFCYDLYKEKIDVTDDNAMDTLSYRPYDIIKFNPKRSGALTEDTIVTILNPFLVGIVNTVKKISPGLLSIVDKAIGPLLSDPKTIYITADVKTLLWTGIPVNCTSKESIVKAVCGQIKSNVPDIQLLEKDVYLFSLLGSRNATVGKKIIVKRGTKNYEELGKLVEYDGKKSLNTWGSTECNTFDGTDGWIFPPLVKHGSDLKLFSTDLCRNMRLKYEGPSVYKGLEVNKYSAEFGDQSTDPDEKCYCATPKSCLKKGILDLTKCLGIPLFGTLPHMYGVDKSYSSQISGLHPEKEKHIISAKTEPLSTAPVEAYIRFQANLQITKINKITQMQNLPTALHPIIWFEQGTQLEDDLLSMIKIIYKIKTIIHVLNGTIFVVSLSLLAGSIYIYNKQNKVTVSPVVPFYEEEFEEEVNKKEKNYSISSAETAVATGIY